MAARSRSPSARAPSARLFWQPRRHTTWVTYVRGTPPPNTGTHNFVSSPVMFERVYTAKRCRGVRIIQGRTPTKRHTTRVPGTKEEIDVDHAGATGAGWGKRNSRNDHSFATDNIVGVGITQLEHRALPLG